MESKSEKQEYIIDTSALISIGAIGIIKDVLKIFNIVTTLSVINELKEFAKYDDEYGKAGKEVLRHKEKFAVKKAEIKEHIEHIQKTDNELYNLSKNLSLPLITDDIKFSRHVSGKIDTRFSTFFLMLLVASNHMAKEKALEQLDKLRDIRNWKSNLIYLVTKSQLEKL